MRQCDMKWRTGSYYHKGNSKLCFEARTSFFVPQNLATFEGGWFYSEVVKPVNYYQYGTEKEAI